MPRDYTKDERDELAAQGSAMPDGSYPTPDCAALSDAITAYGRETGDRGELRRYLARRKIELGCEDVDLPDTWHLTKGATHE